MKTQHSNRLLSASSPYLQQHAHNPVDWYPWSEEALARARELQRPIFLSVGYSACHWCHVMERESFEDERIAELMNENFINIKVDREERPDLDRIYMQAVQALTGQGGWPMSVWLTPELKPFYGGTYFPPRPRQGMPSFPQLLDALAEAWRNRRDQVEEAAEQMTQALQGLNQLPREAVEGSLEVAAQAFQELRARYDERHGGFGGAPKFPPSMSLGFLLRHHFRNGSAVALKMVTHTLEKMARGGIYDQLGGGFHRYSVDADWRVPHFEKMLYDNALLSGIYVEAWQATSNPEFKRVAEETLDYVLREMTAPEGGFYSAQDADSDGEEGSYFVFSKTELEALLKADAGPFCEYYGVSAAGNFEGKNILHIPRPLEAVAANLHLEPGQLDSLLQRCRRLLLDHRREQRTAPGRDEKVLLSWNGLMLCSMARAAAAFGRSDYLQAAQRNARFLLDQMVRGDGRMSHWWKDGKAGGLAFADGYAGLMNGLLELFQVDFEPHWLAQAKSMARILQERFWDHEDRALFFSDPEVAELLTRPKNFEDGATPSGNSLFLHGLLQLARLTGQDGYQHMAARGLSRLSSLAGRLPSGFGKLLCALESLLGEKLEIVLSGPSDSAPTQRLLAVCHRHFHPGKVVALAGVEGLDPALSEGRTERQNLAYVCRDQSCFPPVGRPEELAEMLSG